MKPRSTQFGVRENTASSRQHAPRSAMRSTPNQSAKPSDISREEAQPISASFSQTSSLGSPNNAAHTRGHRGRGKPRKAPSDCSRSSRLIASPCVLGLRTDTQTILGANTELPAWKVLALPSGRSVGLGRVPTARLACCLTCGLHSKATQNKLDGPSMEERWLEEVSSKDRSFSAVLGESLGGALVGGRNSSRRHARQAETIGSDWDRSRNFRRAVSRCKRLSQRLASINSGKARPQSVRTFGTFVEEDWMPVVLPTLKYATQKHYRYMLDVHLIPAFGTEAASRTHAGRVAKLSQSKTQGRFVVGNRSSLQVRSEQDSRCSRGMGLYRRERAQKTKLPRRQHGTERTVLTPVQVRNLVTALNHPARSVTLLLVLTGLRVGELLAFRWGSVDLKARMLRVCETVYDGHFDQPKTNAVCGLFQSERKRRRF